LLKDESTTKSFDLLGLRPTPLIVLYVVLVFIYLFGFGIKIGGVPIGMILGVACGLLLLVKGHLPRFSRFWQVELIILGVMIVFLVIIEITTGPGINVSSFSVYMFRMVLEGLLPAYVLGRISASLHLDYRFFCRMLLYLCLFQLFAAAIMVAFPAVKNFYLDKMLVVDTEAVIRSDLFSLLRGFGIGYAYLCWFPFALALMVIQLLFTRTIHSRPIQGLFIIGMFALIGLNARIGFIPILFGLLWYAFRTGRRELARDAFYSVGVILLLILCLSALNLGGEFEARVKFLKGWVIDEGFLNLFGDKEGNTMSFLNNFNIFSQFSIKDFLIGRGELLIPENQQLYNDVGYIQILYTGGLLLSGLLYGLFGVFLARLRQLIRKTTAMGLVPWKMRYFPIVCIISMYVAHYKLRFFELNEAVQFLFLQIAFLSALIQQSTTKDGDCV